MTGFFAIEHCDCLSSHHDSNEHSSYNDNRDAVPDGTEDKGRHDGFSENNSQSPVSEMSKSVASVEKSHALTDPVICLSNLLPWVNKGETEETHQSTAHRHRERQNAGIDEHNMLSSTVDSPNMHPFASMTMANGLMASSVMSTTMLYVPDGTNPATTQDSPSRMHVNHNGSDEKPTRRVDFRRNGVSSSSRPLSQFI